MISYKIVTIKQREVDKITCDRCKKEFVDEMELQEFHHIEFIGGYTSVFGDMNLINCDLCQYCLKELIGKFCNYNDE